MATIGTFEPTEDGFKGRIQTLSVDAQVDIKAVEAKSEKAPIYRIYKGESEIGAVWEGKNKDGKPYLSASIDDPGFSKPVRGVLAERDDGKFSLYWNREPEAEKSKAQEKNEAAKTRGQNWPGRGGQER